MAILYHPEREVAIAEATRLTRIFDEAGIASCSGSAWDDAWLRGALKGRDLAVALGGDGTILSVGREGAGSGVPTLGINLGHVGFLAELTPDLVDDAMERIIAQDYWIERRHVLDVQWEENGIVKRHRALNEAALARGTSTRAIRVSISIDDFPYTTQTADGVMVATATGSTAYSLAAGGPIMYPEASDMLLTPVSPHLNIGRSLVLPCTASVSLTLQGDRDGMLAIDGQTECGFEVGQAVIISSSPEHAEFARLGPQTYFYSVLANRLH